MTLILIQFSSIRITLNCLGLTQNVCTPLRDLSDPSQKYAEKEYNSAVQAIRCTPFRLVPPAPALFHQNFCQAVSVRDLFKYIQKKAFSAVCPLLVRIYRFLHSLTTYQDKWQNNEQ